MIGATDLDAIVRAMARSEPRRPLPTEIGRQLRLAANSTAVVPATRPQIARANANRVALGFSGDGVSLGSVVAFAASGFGGGIFLPAANPFLWMTIEQFGTFVQIDWFATTAAPSWTVSTFEVIWNPEG